MSLISLDISAFPQSFRSMFVSAINFQKFSIFSPIFPISYFLIIGDIFLKDILGQIIFAVMRLVWKFWTALIVYGKFVSKAF